MAVSGSFRPLPVSTHTTRSPLVNLPAACALMRPATLDAEDGSQNTPSCAASMRYAARISSSVTASTWPPESFMAVMA